MSMIFAEPPQRTDLNEAQLRVHSLEALCFACGQRRGKHRYGDEVCPNVHWKTGNGQPQWRDGWRFKFARNQ